MSDELNARELEQLLRWDASGGTWRILRRDRSSVEISLRTCVGEAEMGRITSSDPRLLAYVDAESPRLG